MDRLPDTRTLLNETKNFLSEGKYAADEDMEESFNYIIKKIKGKKIGDFKASYDKQKEEIIWISPKQRMYVTSTPFYQGYDEWFENITMGMYSIKYNMTLDDHFDNFFHKGSPEADYKYYFKLMKKILTGMGPEYQEKITHLAGD